MASLLHRSDASGTISWTALAKIAQMVVLKANYSLSESMKLVTITILCAILHDALAPPHPWILIGLMAQKEFTFLLYFARIVNKGIYIVALQWQQDLSGKEWMMMMHLINRPPL